MRQPPFLKQGDTIGLTATARKISKECVDTAVGILESWGLKVVLGNNLFNHMNRFAGTDQQRTEDIQSMLDNDDIKAILLASGGYGTVRIISHLNFEHFIQHPKWIIGFSDITVLHSAIQSTCHIQSLHALMAMQFDDNPLRVESLNSLKKALFGDSLKYSFETYEKNRLGECEGTLVGGNLSILYSLRGTPFDIDTEGRILFIEDVDEYLYHIERMMLNLKLGGKLAGLKGLIVGGMTDLKDNDEVFGKTVTEIISDIVSDYHYPVCYNFPAGHIKNNMALITGAKVSLSIQEHHCHLQFLRNSGSSTR